MGSWLTGNSQSQNDPTPPATALRLQTSVQGRPVTILWGTQRVAANLIWQGAFTATQVIVGSVGSNNFIDHIFSKAQPIFQTDYSVSCVFGIGHGTLAVNGFFNPAGTSMLTNRAWNGTTAISIAALGFTIFDGSFAQNPWPYLVSAFSADAFSYRGTGLAVQANFNLGTSPDMPVLNWEAQNYIANYGPTGQDADAADVALDVVSNPIYGINFPFFRMDQALDDFFAYSIATGMVVSPIITEQISGQSFLADLFEALNSTPRWSSGRLSVVPWGDSAEIAGTIDSVTAQPYSIPPAAGTTYPTIQVASGTFISDAGVAGFTLAATALPAAGEYVVSRNGLYMFNPADGGTDVTISYTKATGAAYNPDIQPIYDLTADDFLANQGSLGMGITSNDEPIAAMRKRQSDLLNVIKSEFLDRTNNYDPVAIDFKDEASVVTYGKRPSSLKTRHLFALADAAQQSAALECQREQISCMYQVTLPPQFILPDCEDFLTISRAVMGLDRQAVRINEIQENSDGSLTFTLEEFLGTASAPLYGTQANNGTNMDFLQDPGPATDVVIFTAPDALAAPPTGQLTLVVAVSGISAIYGGSNIYFSTDNVNFSIVGVVPQTTMGILSAALPDAAGLDVTNTLSVDLAESFGILPASTHANADSGLPVCFVDNELLSYGTSVLTSAYNYNNTYLQRGEYTSTHSAHPAGSSFVLVDAKPFRMNLATSFLGQTVYFKFQPFNIFQGGLRDISLSPTVAYVVGSAVSRKIPVSAILRGIGTLRVTTTGPTGTSAVLAGSGALRASVVAPWHASAVLAAVGQLKASTTPPPQTFSAGATLINTTLSGGDLIAQHANTSLGGARNINYKSAGKYYFEITLDIVTTGVSGVCVLPSDQDYTTTHFGAAMYAPTGVIWASGGNSGASLGTVVSGNVIGCAADLDSGLAWFRIAPSGDWNGNPAADPATGTGGVNMNAATSASRAPSLVFGDTGSDGTEKGTANLGATAFTGSVPSGFNSGWG